MPSSKAKPTRIPLTETVDLVRKTLAHSFPDTAFTIQPERRGRTSWIVVAWESGPPVDAVREVTIRFEGMRYYPASGRRRRVAVEAPTRRRRTKRVTYEPACVVLHRRPGGGV